MELIRTLIKETPRNSWRKQEEDSLKSRQGKKKRNLDRGFLDMTQAQARKSRNKEVASVKLKSFPTVKKNQSSHSPRAVGRYLQPRVGQGLKSQVCEEPNQSMHKTDGLSF